MVLELGPGPDLGIGLYLLSKGVLEYYAFDKYALVSKQNSLLYEALYKKINEFDSISNSQLLREQINLLVKGSNSKLKYIVDKEFNLLNHFQKNTIDLIFSQAAFEHFDDYEQTINQLSQIIKPGGILITEVDLKTHSRWIRDIDPNNIYKFSDLVYNFLKFSGSPNRIRPWQYITTLKDFGWKNIQIFPLTTLSSEVVNHDKRNYSSEFRPKQNDMHLLTIMLCATKK